MGRSASERVPERELQHKGLVAQGVECSPPLPHPRVLSLGWAIHPEPEVCQPEPDGLDHRQGVAAVEAVNEQGSIILLSDGKGLSSAHMSRAEGPPSVFSGGLEAMEA